VEIIADLEAKAGLVVAARYNASFERLYDILAQFPGTGPPRPALGGTFASASFSLML
jgi:plasmid stabilization system protein ParE